MFEEVYCEGCGARLLVYAECTDEDPLCARCEHKSHSSPLIKPRYRRKDPDTEMLKDPEDRTGW